MKLSEQSRSSIAEVVKKALRRYLSDKGQLFVTDIHLQPVQETGGLVIYNDDDEELSHVVVQEWVDCTPEAFHDSVEFHLKQVLESLRKEGFLVKVALMKPYSFVWVDGDKETISELMVVDEEETMLISGELLKGLDEELNAFLKDLLEK